MELDKNFGHAWNNMGISLRELGRNEEALNCFDKAIELDKNFSIYGLIKV